MDSYSYILFLLKFIYFGERETERETERDRERQRERERERERETERETERIPSSFCAVSTEPDSSLNPMNREIMTGAEIESQMLNRLIPPCAPHSPQVFKDTLYLYLRKYLNIYGERCLHCPSVHLSSVSVRQSVLLCHLFLYPPSACGRRTLGSAQGET